MATPNRGRMQAIREMMEPCCDPGAIVYYRGLRVEKPMTETDHQTWLVIGDDGWLETINLAAIATASDLKTTLDELAEEHGHSHTGCECGECGCSLPGD